MNLFYYFLHLDNIGFKHFFRDQGQIITMNRQELKEKVLDTIDSHAKEIIQIGDDLWKIPEVGYREYKTSEYVEKQYEKIGWYYENKLAITGSKAYLKEKGVSPTVAIVGELDSLDIPTHPSADPRTGWVHACGHHAQITAMLGAGFGLNHIIDELDGNVVMMAVPAEELIQMDFRNKLIEDGKITFMGGKQEFIHVGAMNDIDMTIGSHSTGSLNGAKLGTGGTENGFIAKLTRYTGVEAHAGDHPDEAVNALNAAMLGIMGAHANRETFKDEDHIRFHPILTKGGSIVNNVPADVHMESFVRGATVDAVKNANIKVNNALRAGAMAVGAEIELIDVPGYMPYHRDPVLDKVLRENCLALTDEVPLGGHSCGSTDMGDFSCVHPTTNLVMGGVSGSHHHKSFSVEDKMNLYVLPAKALALTVIDLLYDGAAKAKEVMDKFEPVIPLNDYTEFMKKLVE
jgi:amidohydrolase